jgi:small subunit ribosomal protein S5
MAAPQQGNRGRRERREEKPKDPSDLTEKVVFINRCAKVVKGGRRFSFSALIVSGDKKGKVGVGFGKANEVSEAIRKASESARKSLVPVAIQSNTIPHEVIGEHGGGRVLLRPASPGTGVIAGGGVRAVVEAAGIRDVLAKSLGSSNHANVVKATIGALQQLRLRETILKTRGIAIKQVAAVGSEN